MSRPKRRKTTLGEQEKPGFGGDGDDSAGNSDAAMALGISDNYSLNDFLTGAKTLKQKIAKLGAGEEEIKNILKNAVPAFKPDAFQRVIEFAVDREISAQSIGNWNEEIKFFPTFTHPWIPASFELEITLRLRKADGAELTADQRAKTSLSDNFFESFFEKIEVFQEGRDDVIINNKGLPLKLRSIMNKDYHYNSGYKNIAKDYLDTYLTNDERFAGIVHNNTGLLGSGVGYAGLTQRIAQLTPSLITEEGVTVRYPLSKNHMLFNGSMPVLEQYGINFKFSIECDNRKYLESKVAYDANTRQTNLFKLEVMGTPKLHWKEIELTERMKQTISFGINDAKLPLRIAQGIDYTCAQIPIPTGTRELTVTDIQSFWQPSRLYLKIIPEIGYDHSNYYCAEPLDRSVSIVEEVEVRRITAGDENKTYDFTYDNSKVRDRKKMYKFYKAAKTGGNSVLTDYEQYAFGKESDKPVRLLTFDEYFNDNNLSDGLVFDLSVDRGFTEDASRNPINSNIEVYIRLKANAVTQYKAFIIGSLPYYYKIERVNGQYDITYSNSNVTK